MPTINLKPQANGMWSDAQDLVGASLAWQAVDDSDALTHDGDATRFKLPRAGTVFTGNGRASFKFFLQAEGLIPTSLTVNVGAKRTAAGNPGVLIGFARGSFAAFDITPMAPGVGYSVESRIFAVNPFTSAAWAEGDLVGLEPCVQSEVGAFAGSNQITLLSCSLTYRERHNFDPILPRNYGIQ